jgi:hypothetical protein
LATTTTTTEIKLITKLIMDVKMVDQPGCSFKNLIIFQDVCLKTKKKCFAYLFFLISFGKDNNEIISEVN